MNVDEHSSKKPKLTKSDNNCDDLIALSHAITLLNELKERKNNVLLVLSNEDASLDHFVVTFSTKIEKDVYLELLASIIDITRTCVLYQKYMLDFLSKKIKKVISQFMKKEIDEKEFQDFAAKQSWIYPEILQLIEHFTEFLPCDTFEIFLSHETPLIQRKFQHELAEMDGKIHAIRHLYSWS